MICDFEASETPLEYACDVAIVGAGAVGISMAARLSRQGLDVLLLEGGGRSLEADSQRLYLNATSSGLPLDGLHNGRFRLLGGTTNFWGGQLLRFDPIVFETRPWLAECGWPFGRAALDSYYDEAMALMGLDAYKKDDRLVWDALNISQPLLDDKLETFFTRWLNLANFSKLFEDDLRGPKMRVLVHANATELEANETGDHIVGVKLRTLNGRKGSVRARRIVLACGTVEIVRLLLLPLANGRKAPWSDNAWLGRGFLEHIDCNAGIVSPIDLRAFHDLFDNVYLDGFKYHPKLRPTDDVQREAQIADVCGQFIFNSIYTEHLVNLKIFVRALRNGQLPSDLRKLPKHLLALGRVVAPLVYRYFRSNRALNFSDGGIVFRLSCEQLPIRASRISLQNQRDALDMPTVDVNWQIDGREIETLAFFAELVKATFEQRGLATLDINPLLTARDPAFLNTTDDGFHQMGGARMSVNPRDGVVDGNLRVHGADNLYVAGAASYPTTGFGNPTFTAIALGLKLSDHLAAEHP